MLDFIQNYGMGAAGTLASLIYLYYSIKEKVWLWPWGIVASLLSIGVFYSSRLYADMSLQLYYLIISFYGWWYWSLSKGSKNNKHVPIVSLSQSLGVKLSVIAIALYVVLLMALLKIPELLNIAGSEMPYLDAATTAASFVATWMLARKILEHWLVWVVVDLVSMIMYFYKAILFDNSGDLYFYSFLFLVYTIGAIWGYKQWQKIMRDEQAIKA